MKAIGELMTRPPSAEEADTLAHVLEIAEAWRGGGVDLAGVRSACTGYDRWQAMRFAPLGSAAKHLLLELADALVNTDKSGFLAHNGWVNMSEEVYGQATAMTNARGERVWVWPMHSINGEKTYPLVDVPLDSKRIERQHAATMAYNEFRRRKRGG